VPFISKFYSSITNITRNENKGEMLTWVHLENLNEHVFTEVNLDKKYAFNIKQIHIHLWDYDISYVITSPQ